MSSRYLAYLSLSNTSQELYNSIIEGNYSYAVKLTRNLAEKNSSIITDVVSQLTGLINPKLVSYAYKLWSSGEKDIIKQYFPKSYAFIFNEDKVTLVNEKYNKALKLDVNTDNDGDRKPWGDSKDKTSRRVIWKLIPIWENNKVHFKIKNLDCSQFLKMGLYPDSIHDRKVYGSNDHSTMRHEWYLDPIFFSNKFLFLIRNKQFNQRLKLAVAEDNIGDQLLWGHNGNIPENDADRFAWVIEHTNESNERFEEL